MTYALDPELAAAVPMMPKMALPDISATREQMTTMMADRGADVDSTRARP